MPRVHVERVSVTCQMYRLINLIGHTWHPYFSEHTGMTECIRVSLKLQSKITKQNTPSISTIPRKETSGKICSHPIKTLELLDRKQKVTRQDLDILLRLNLLYL